MAQRFLALLAVLGLTLGIYACGSSGGSNPVGASKGGGGGSGGGTGCTSALPTYNLLHNTILGSWAGVATTLEIHSYVVSPPTRLAALTMGPGPLDPISGMTSTQITTICIDPAPGGPCSIFTATPYLRITSCPILTVGCPSPSLPTGYSACGRMEFNLQIDLPLAQVSSVILSWGGSTIQSYSLPPSQLSNSFKHYSLPFSSFKSSGTPGGSASTAFQISLLRSATGSTPAGFSLSDVKWVGP